MLSPGDTISDFISPVKKTRTLELEVKFDVSSPFAFAPSPARSEEASLKAYVLQGFSGDRTETKFIVCNQRIRPARNRSLKKLIRDRYVRFFAH
jgi:hypothetical protein